MADFTQIGTQFVQHYYSALDGQKDQLPPLYAENSMLTFEGEQFMGAENIANKFNSIGSVSPPNFPQ